jgi:Tfp pilus assembly protein PilO
MKLWRRIYEERKRVLLPLAIVLVANIAVLVLAVFPLRNVVSAAESRAVDAKRDLAEAMRLERQITQARTSKEQADDELRRFYAEVLPRDFATAEIATNLWLNEAATESGLSFKSSRFSTSEIRDSDLTRAYSRVTLEGRYPDIRRFLYEVETAKEFIIVERVELAEQGSQPGANSPLEVSLLVSTYFLTKPHP